MKPRSLIEGPAAVVPARVAAMLEYRFPFDDLRVQVRGKDSEFDDVLMALHTAAMLYVEATRNELASAVGSGVAEVAEVAASSSVMSAQQVADAVGCTDRGVRLAASKQHLAGVKVAGCWWFEIDDVATWVATRAHKGCT